MAQCQSGGLGGGFERLPAPGEQVAQLGGRVFRDAAEHIAKVGFRIEAVQLGGADQAVDRSGALATGV